MCCIRIAQLQAVWFSGRITQQSPLEASLEVEREFLGGKFADKKYRLDDTFTPFTLSTSIEPFVDECETVEVYGEQTPVLKVGEYTLRPLAGTILRQTTFAVQDTNEDRI